MSRDIWNPRQYRAYSSHRARPFYELLARVDVEAPAYVVDLGCGPGERTVDLTVRWPAAVVEGIDSSPQMIAEARLLATGRSLSPGDVAVVESGHPGMSPLAVARGGSRDGAGGAPRSGANSPDSLGQRGGELRFSVGDLADWMPDRPVDVIFSNAAFQWVPEHRALLPRWVQALAPGGRLAFSMPGNFDAPSHRLLRELCESPRWRDRLSRVNRHSVVGDPADYFELLSSLGCEVDAWETTYAQVLRGPDPVLEWMKGTALRPALDALPDEAEREEFVTELAISLRTAYPPGPHGTLFPFRRIFVIAGPPKSASAPS